MINILQEREIWTIGGVERNPGSRFVAVYLDYFAIYNQLRGSFCSLFNFFVSFDRFLHGIK